jgi:hypothetical protein
MHLSDIADDLPRYRDWAPTGFDTRGLNLPDRQDWLVCPCGQNRDSEPLDQSNFHAAQAILTAANVEHEVHSFGHWACGWVEIVLVHPDGAETLAGIVSRLADYPVLDESDLSDRETEAEYADWEAWGARQFASNLQDEFELAHSTYHWLRDHPDQIRQLQSEYECERGDYSAPDITRDELAKRIRAWRREVRS